MRGRSGTVGAARFTTRVRIRSMRGPYPYVKVALRAERTALMGTFELLPVPSRCGSEGSVPMRASTPYGDRDEHYPDHGGNDTMTSTPELFTRNEKRPANQSGAEVTDTNHS